MKAEQLKKYDVVSRLYVRRCTAHGHLTISIAGPGVIWNAASVIPEAGQGLQEEQRIDHGKESHACFPVVSVSQYGVPLRRSF